jgi:DNA primase
MQFREILEDHNIPIAPEGHHHHTHGWIQFDCPFCGMNTHRYHMGYNIDGGFVNCWKCGGHSVASVLREYTQLSYHKIKDLLKQVGTVYKRVKQEQRRKKVEIPNVVGKLRPPHIKYLESRGYNVQELQRLWKIKGIGAAGRLHWRIFIPIEQNGRTVSWTTRSLSDSGQRYISAKPEQESVRHKNILYGMDYVRSAVIITEGPLDVWRVGPGAVCTFGSAFTTPQVLALTPIQKRIICYDREDEAQKQAKKLMSQLGPFPGETLNVLLNANDPGTAKHREIKKLRKFLK